jgi:hypothetical protein
MKSPNKKPGTRQRIHERITWQAAIAKITPAEYRDYKAFPDLLRLLKSARNAARTRKNPGARIVFTFAGKHYAARFTTFNRIIVEDRKTGRLLVASAPFSLDDDQ